MSLTRAELELTVDEAQRALLGGYVERVDDLGHETILVELYVRPATHHLLLSARSSFSRAHLVSTRAPRAPEPSAFVMLLRKRLQGTRLRGLELSGEDRVVRLRAEGREGEVNLVAELTGRHANVFLVEGEGDVIVASLRPNLSHKRALVPGQPYAYPLESEVAASAMAGAPRLDAATPGASAEALYAKLEARAEHEALGAALGRALREAQKKLRRRAEAIAGDRARAEASAPYHHLGSLLVAQLHLVRRGMTEVHVTDWSLDPPAEVAIPLEPALTPKANVERLFARYRKYKDGLAQIAAQEARLRADEARVADLQAQLDGVLAAASADSAEGLAPLRALRGVLVKAGLLRAAAPARAKEKEAPREPFRRFVSRDGKPIWVGRGPADNDKLTFRVARGNDLWLHARDYPGAHVVVPLGRGEEPLAETLLDAATLAAHYSQAKGAAVVDVSHTRCKHVHKPKGAAPGLVSMSESRTVAVRMEPERLERLLRDSPAR